MLTQRNIKILRHQLPNKQSHSKGKTNQSKKENNTTHKGKQTENSKQRKLKNVLCAMKIFLSSKNARSDLRILDEF